MLAQPFRRDFQRRNAKYRQIDGRWRLVRCRHAVEQVFQVIEHDGLQAAVFQLMLQRLTRQVMMFKHCGAQASERNVERLFLVFAGLGQFQADPEFRTFARCAVDTDFAAHLFDQAFGDHQTQPGTARLARERVVGLAEGLEQCPHILAGQADPGVLHADAQLRVLFGFIL